MGIVKASGYRASLQSDKNVLKFILVMVAQLCEYIKTTESYVLNE